MTTNIQNDLFLVIDECMKNVSKIELVFSCRFLGKNTWIYGRCNPVKISHCVVHNHNQHLERILYEYFPFVCRNFSIYHIYSKNSTYKYWLNSQSIGNRNLTKLKLCKWFYLCIKEPFWELKKFDEIQWKAFKVAHFWGINCLWANYVFIYIRTTGNCPFNDKNKTKKRNWVALIFTSSTLDIDEIVKCLSSISTPFIIRFICVFDR